MSVSAAPAPPLDTAPRYRTYGIVAALGALIMGVGVFAPWLTAADESLTGWDISDAAAGSQQWYIGNMFDTFSPFFPGYTVLALAALFALTGIGLVVARRTLGRATRLLMVVLPLVALTAVAMNLYSFMTQDPKVVDLGWGLIVAVVGGFVAAVAIAYPGSRRTTPPR